MVVGLWSALFCTEALLAIADHRFCYCLSSSNLPCRSAPCILESCCRPLPVPLSTSRLQSAASHLCRFHGALTFGGTTRTLLWHGGHRKEGFCRSLYGTLAMRFSDTDVDKDGKINAAEFDGL